jgi:hypothetical protein
VAQKSLWSALQPVPPVLRDVLSRLEAKLAEFGFVREPAPPSTAMYSVKYHVEEKPPGRLLVLLVEYVDEEPARGTGTRTANERQAGT